MEYFFGITYVNRCMVALLIFFILNMTLGIYGAFQLKNEARISEFGLRMAMGSSRLQLCRLYLTEGWILGTIGCVVSFIITANLVYAGLDMDSGVGRDSGYWVNDRWLCFTWCAFLTWLLMIGIVGLSVWLPTRTAAKIQPADALREE